MRVRRPAALLASLALVATAAAAIPAEATAVATPPSVAKVTPKVNGIYPLTAQPEQLVAGPDGNMWVTLSGSGTGDDLLKISPSGVRTYYDVVGGSIGALAVAAGKLWSTTSNGLVEIPPGDPSATIVHLDGDVTEARGITRGPDGFLWAASGDKVIRFSPANPTAAVATTVPGMSAREVAATPHRVWVADNSGRVLAFKPDASGTFVTKGVGGSPQGIAAGPGDQVVYTNPGTTPQTIGLVTPTTNPRLINVPLADPSFSVGYGADGAYWVGLFNEQKMIRVTPQGQNKRMFSFLAPFKPRHTARGPNGTIWVSLQDPGNDGAIARITGVRDTTVGVTLKGKRAKVAMRKAPVRLACPAAETSGPCRGRVVLRATTRGRPVLGRKGWSAAVGATTVVKVPLRRRTVRAIPGRGLKATAVITVRDGAGNTRTVRRSVRLAR